MHSVQSIAEMGHFVSYVMRATEEPALKNYLVKEIIDFSEQVQ